MNLSKVRAHSGGNAGEIAKSLGAKAFTVGNDLYFGKAGEAKDAALVAHALWHLVQEGKGKTPKTQDGKALTRKQVCIWWVFAACLLWIGVSAAIRPVFRKFGNLLAESTRFVTVSVTSAAYRLWHRLAWVGRKNQSGKSDGEQPRRDSKQDAESDSHEQNPSCSGRSGALSSGRGGFCRAD
jgi:hypothetical protein